MSSIIVDTITPTVVDIGESEIPVLVPSIQENISLTDSSVPVKTLIWNGSKIISGNKFQSQKNNSFKWSGSKTDNKTLINEDKRTIQPLDIVYEWVDSEYDDNLHLAKSTFLEFAKRNMKKENYTIVYRGYDIIEYLSEGSKGFFHMIVDHSDLKTGKIIRLYEWKFKGNFVYILAIDDFDGINNSWLEDRHQFYSELVGEGQLKDGTFDKKTYSILRSNCMKDFANKFTSTWFFNDFDKAKCVVTMKVNGYVKFLKKDFKKIEEDEIKV